MNITLIGTGNMGSAFAQQLSQAGHQVRITGRDLDKAHAVAAEHQNVEAFTADQGLGQNEVVIVATAYQDAVTALKSLGSLEGKVVIDITNPLTADYMGLTIGHSTSAAEEIAKALSWSRVSTPYSPKCWPAVPRLPTSSKAVCSWPAIAREPNKPPLRLRKAWVGKP